ncbi:MAG TPA: PqqD family peptide modification chaperone [Rhodocyclaceae bacterium]|nr:PqqD family peptide modification chaperone [Rhodocyclaceae bacterium]HNC79607.1 PqqD family peptide modification chaperone [Rhodocyclaceae bacterium]
MTASLFSPHWYRVADLRPRLRAQVRPNRQRWRDQLWYVLADQATGRHHRINETAYRFIGRCDGRRTVQQVWDAVLEADGDAAPTQDEVVELLTRLYESELLQSERSPDVDALFQRQSERAAGQRRATVNPLAFRLALGDPHRWLVRLDPLAHAVFRPGVFGLWLVLMGVALITAGLHWPELRDHAARHVSSPRYLALLWLCYPVIKALHELGHALAVRRWGGEVHEAGVVLLALVPAPYVDASAASGFLGRGPRAIVGAAGILVELALAAGGLFLWLNTAPGWINDIAFVVMTVGSVSTLLINGNPLLRFDGYHVLCDALDLPNLAPRSTLYWSDLLRRRVLRVAGEPPQMGAGEAKWLRLYAPLSALYRLAVGVSIMLWLGSKWFVLGVVAAAYLAVAMLFRPVVGWVRQSLAAAAPGPALVRAHRGLLLLLGVPGLLLFVVPMPYVSVAPAVVWLPDRAQVRPDVDGFVSELPVRDGQNVAPGELLAVLRNDDLAAERERLDSRLQGLRSEQFRLLLRDPVGAQNQAEEIARTEAELTRADERLAGLQVRAQAGGRLVMPRQADLPGGFVRKGQVLGYVFPDGDTLVRAAVPERDGHRVRLAGSTARVRLVGGGAELEARVRTDQPAATRKLPSPALGERAGGPYPVEPGDEDGTLALEPVFLVDLSLPGHALADVGRRAWVRFDLGYAPLAVQAYRHAAQLFLKHFNPTE